MRNTRNKRRPNKKNKEISIEKIIHIKQIIIPVIIIISILLFSTIFALLGSFNNKVMARTKVNGVNISNLTIDEAYKKLNDELSKQKGKNIILKYEEYETSISLEQLEVSYKTEEAINTAYKIGRNRNILKSNYQILSNLLFGRKIEQDIYINEETLTQVIDDIEVKLPNALVQSGYDVEENNLIITRGKTGLVLKKEELKNTLIETIKNQIKGIDAKDILLPVEERNPDEINIDQIYQEICKMSQDAYYDENEKKLHKQIDGIEFAITKEEAKQLIQEEKEEYVIPLKIVKPNITVADLAYQDFFPEVLAKFTTRYDESAENRSNNIKLATQKINGTILMPGETFSYNKVVGARTIKAGYKEATIYMGGKVVNGIGGGICQVSTTLYNATLLANLEIVSRRNHYFITSYVSASRDATVSYGSIDFQFKNTRSYPIKIECTAKNGICQVTIKGTKEDEEYTVEIQDRITQVIPYTTKEIKTDELATGQQQVIQKGVNGYKSEAYRIVKLQGKVISKTLLSKDSYNPLEEIIKIGK